MSKSVEQSVEQIFEIQCMISDDEMHIRNDLCSKCNIRVHQCYIRVPDLDLLLIMIIKNHRIGNSEPRLKQTINFELKRGTYCETI